MNKILPSAFSLNFRKNPILLNNKNDKKNFRRPIPLDMGNNSSDNQILI